ncbi:hypothetical protein EYR38_002331 [Pleurotus pulmonarius]|nr:hypothetical protein EYR38_002331 [Pleurotus pulmonarius]
MDSDPPDVPMSNIPTLKLGNKHAVGNGPHPSQHKQPFSLFPSANTQTHSRGLVENEGANGQTTKRFGASPVWNTRRQPFALQIRRTNQSANPAAFSLDAAHTASNTVGYPSKMVDYNEHHYDKLARPGTDSSPGVALPSKNAYLAPAAPVTPAQGLGQNTSNPARQTPSNYSASPHVAYQDQDFEFGDEDPLTRAMKLGASELKHHRNEARQQRQEIEELRQRLKSLTAERAQEAAAHLKALADANRRSSEELNRCKESQSLEITRVKDAAKAELDASLAEAKTAREEASRIKQMASIHAERDQNDLQTVRSKLEALKSRTKQAVEESNQRFFDLQVDFQDLKRKHDAINAPFQAVTHELQDVRKMVGNSLQAVQPFLDGDAMSVKNQDTKALIAELQHDRDNSRQVNDILRGKLHILSAQLADAQERVKTFEAKEITYEGKMALWAQQLSEAGERNTTLVSRLDAREHETTHALADAAQLEEKLANAEERYRALMSNLEETCTQVVELESVKEENTKLALNLEERNRNFVALNASHQEASSRLSVVEQRNQDLQTQVSNLTIEVNALRSQRDTLSSEKAKNLADLDMSATRLRSLEMQLNTTQSEVEHSNLEMKLMASSKDEAAKTAASIADRCRALERENGDLEAKGRFLEGQIKTTQASLDAANAELKEAQIREQVLSQAAQRVESLESLFETANTSLRKVEFALSSCETKFSALQDRFKSQTDALRMSQDQCIDLQERLSTAEAANTTKATLSASEWRTEAVALKEHYETREDQVKKALEDIKRQQDAMAAAHAEAKRQPTVDFDRQLAQQEALYAKLIDAHEQRFKATEGEIIAMRRQCNESDVKIQDLTSELANARATAESSSVLPELEAQLQKQQTRIEELQGIVTDFSRRSSSLFQRYQEGALDNPEKIFVDLLLQQARSVHEDDLVLKGNELRRRDNTIESLQTKVAVLESTLARRLQSKDPEVRDADNGDSIINIKSWVLSSPATCDGMNVEHAGEEMGIDPKATNIAYTNLPQGPKMDVTSTAAFFDMIPTGTTQDASSLPTTLASRRTRRNTGAKNSQLPRTDPREHPEAPGVTRLGTILSDLSDIDDDVPISKLAKSRLGKHARPDSPIESPSPEHPSKPTRRLKATVQKEGSSRRKRPDNVSLKSRKRKD